MKKWQKKLLTVSAVLVAGVSAAACATSSSTSSTEASKKATKKTKKSSKKTTSKKNSKVLVVYFSGTGNTRRVAKEIAKQTKATTFEITPKDPYTSNDLDWTSESSRVVQEYEHPSKRNIKLTTTKVPKWSKYKTVFFGYPLWWQNAAWPVNNFVKANSFKGKTVIPFCTSTSSSIDQSVRNLKKMNNTGKWQSGHRFSESYSKTSVDNWVKSLNVK